MRRLIRADIRRILKKRSVIVLFLLALFYLCSTVVGAYVAYEQGSIVAVKSLMSRLTIPELILGLVKI